tara:strand:+ start:181 stop:1143 length:963 start_codon:yes stop_codon:yes gene_type:complete
MSSVELQDYFTKDEITILPRLHNKILWDKNFKDMKFVPHFFSNKFLDYQNEYWQGTCEELSFMAYKGKNFLFHFPIFKNKEKFKFFNIDEYLSIPQYLQDLLQKKIQSKLTINIFNFFKDSKTEYLLPCEQYNSELVKLNDCEVLDISLKKSLKEVLINYRNSTMNRLNKKIEGLSYIVVSKEECLEEWNNFKSLHKIVSGKATRSDLSWKLQYDNVINGSSIFIYSKFKNQLIAGCLFDYSRDDMKYSVSVTDPYYKKFNCNLKIISIAIKYAKSIELKNFHLGVLNQGETDIKKKNIHDFKKNFCSKIYKKYGVYKYL